MSPVVTRSQVVSCARSWLGTPYHHQARLKGVGADCIGLLIGVCWELQSIAVDFDITGYSNVPDGVSFQRLAESHMEIVPRRGMMPGHAISVRFDSHPQHFGILADYRHGGMSIIHAAQFADPPRVIETRLLFSEHMRFVSAYKLPGVSDSWS